MAGTDHDISTLNSLIATTIDSIAGYSEAAKEADSRRFVDLFEARAAERRRAVGYLQDEVTRLGGTPKGDGTVLAGAHRAFLNLKSGLTGKNDAAIVAEVDRGEDHIKAKYEAALADTVLSAEVRAAVQTCFESVELGHAEMRSLKLATG